MKQPVPHHPLVRNPIALMLVVGLAGLGLGVLTAYAQGCSREVDSLANSSGSWCLVAALLALLATSQLTAAASGALALGGLLAGYVSGAAARGSTSSTGLIVFWGLAALLAGPLLGLGAHWVKTERPILNAVGAGGMSGLLVGEGVHGLLFIADSTYPPYWRTQIVVGVVLLAWMAAQRLGRPSLVALALGINLVVTAAFVAVARLDLIMLFQQR